VPFAIRAASKYAPRVLLPLLRSSFACSSDQKNTLSFQNELIMLSSLISNKSTCGTKTTGSQSSFLTVTRRSLSM